MVDPKNNYQAFYTRDVTWLKRNYFQPGPEKKNGRVLNIIEVEWPDEHHEPESETQNHFFQSNNDDDPDNEPDNNEQGGANPDNNEQGRANPDDTEQGSEYAHHTENLNATSDNQPTTVSPVVSQEQDPVETQASSADASDAQDNQDDQDDQEQEPPAIGRRSKRDRQPPTRGTIDVGIESGIRE